MSPRVVVPICLVALAFELAAIGWFARSPSRQRYAVFQIPESSDPGEIYWTPSSPHPRYRADPAERLGEFRDEALEWTRGRGSRWEQAVALKDSMLAANGVPDWSDEIRLDDVRTVRRLFKQGKAANCARLTWLYHSYARSLGWDTRSMGFEHDDGIGGYGHAVVEVWLPEREKWALVDLLYDAWFSRDGEPLSLFEVRSALLDTGAPLEMHRDRADPSNDTILGLYRDGSSHLMVNLVDTIVLRDDERFGPLHFARPWLERLPRPLTRLLDNFVGYHPDIRIHYLDEHAAPWGTRRYYLAFRALLAATALTGAGLLLAIVRARRAGRPAPRQPRYST